MLIIGLGNPGKKYNNTRHNAGYMVIDELEKENLDGFILSKTGTFMNESGKAVKKLIADCGLQIADLIIIHDDIDIPLGQFKIQKGRGAAGHKGVQSVINELRTKDFWRIRVGIHPVEKPSTRAKLGAGLVPQRNKVSAAGFVLRNFTKEERKTLKETIVRIPDLLISDIPLNFGGYRKS